MEQVIYYKAPDGKEFKDKEKCLEYEKLLYRCMDIRNSLRLPDKVDDSHAVQQTTERCRMFSDAVMDLCDEIIYGNNEMYEPTESVFIGYRLGKVHLSHVEYLMSGYKDDYPCLWDLVYTVKCMNFTDGVLYPQPFYANNPYKFQGTIL